MNIDIRWTLDPVSDPINIVPRTVSLHERQWEDLELAEALTNKHRDYLLGRLITEFLPQLVAKGKKS